MASQQESPRAIESVMAVIKLISSLSFLILLLLLPSAFADGRSRSPFGFLSGLEGCHKGNKTRGIAQLKQYMERFGYLRYKRSDRHATDDEFDDPLVEAVRTYQRNYHLRVTGALNQETVSQMLRPRCGVPDIVNGTNTMRLRSNGGHGSSSFHTVGHFSFFPNRPRWPSNKFSLTYAFLAGTPANAITATARAFQRWDAATHFTFTQIQNYQAADLKILFARGNHGDGAPFDGRGGVIAHAFAPTVGWFHYDADEPYAVGAVPGAFDLETIALHEIGHLLGLGHSAVQAAIMFPSVSTGVTKGLHPDDTQGIRVLYGV